MTFFSSLPENAGVIHALQLNPAAGRALVALHTAALRSGSRLRSSDKELIAAYVSGLNQCEYCYGVHSRTAAAFGVEPVVLEALLQNVDEAPVEAALKPILRYAKKLTREPFRMLQSDADEVFAAGWDEASFHDAILTVCLFNFMNRLVEGHGIEGNEQLYDLRARALRDGGYESLQEALDNTGRAGSG